MLLDNSEMEDKDNLKQYDFVELGKIYIKSYTEIINNENRDFELGFGEQWKKDERLELIIEEFSSRCFDERLKVYRFFLSGVLHFEDERDYETADQFEKMCEEFYRRILD